MKRLLVVDANLIQAASNSGNPFAFACLRILNRILNICHAAALNDVLRDEWDRHASVASRTWIGIMEKRGKLIERTPRRHSLRDGLHSHFDSEQHREEVLKDLHLIELALDADRVVLSLERRCKDLLEQHTGLLSELLWHNPVQDVEATIRWLEAGAQWDEAPAD